MAKELNKNICRIVGHEWDGKPCSGSLIGDTTQYETCKRCNDLRKYELFVGWETVGFQIHYVKGIVKIDIK